VTRFKPITLALLVGLLAFALGPRASASVSRALSLAELVAKAEHIVIATSIENHARWHENGKLIVTDHTLRVDRSLKGDAKPGERLTVTVLGGKLEGLALQVPGAANFADGALALTFLHTSGPSGDLRVVGMSQGVMPLHDRAGATMVIPGGNGSALMERDEAGALQPAPDALGAPRPLDDLLSEIRALVARGSRAR
jgi:hypothetical protein